jgi:hypothetical protein
MAKIIDINYFYIIKTYKIKMYGAVPKHFALLNMSGFGGVATKCFDTRCVLPKQKYEMHGTQEEGFLSYRQF